VKMEILRHIPRIRVKDLTYNSILTFTSLLMAFILLFVLLSPIIYAYETPPIEDSDYIYKPIITPFKPAIGDSGQHTITGDGWFLGSAAVTTVLKGANVTAKVTLQDHPQGKYKLLVKRDVQLWLDEDVAESAEFDYTSGTITMSVTFTPSYASGENSTNGYFAVLQKEGSNEWVMDDSYPPRLTVLVITDEALNRIKVELGITGISDAKLKTVLSSQWQTTPGLPLGYVIVANLDSINFGHQLHSGEYWKAKQNEFETYFKQLAGDSNDYINVMGNLAFKEILKQELDFLLGTGAGTLLVSVPSVVFNILKGFEIRGVFKDLYKYKGMWVYLDTRIYGNESSEVAWQMVIDAMLLPVSLSQDERDKLRQTYEDAYLASLNYKNSTEIKEKLKSLIVNQSVPKAVFKASILSGLPPLIASFDASDSSPSSGEMITSYFWDFSDPMGETTGTEAKPVHKFNQVGVYQVKLTVTDSSGSTANKTVTVQVNSPLQAVFTMPGYQPGPAPRLVNFDAGGSANAFGTIQSYSWNFGDPASGSSNNAQSVIASHQYVNDGYYVVTLTITGSGYTAQYKQAVTLGSAGPTYISGVLDYSTTWTEYLSPYIVQSNLSVAQGATLTISLGVIVKFTQGVSLTTQGSLVADGTPEKKITFTAYSSLTPGAWGGLTFAAGSTNNLLDNVVVKYATTGVNTSTSSLTISNSTISNSSSNGISVTSASPTISNNTISNNQYGIKTENTSSQPTISGNTISNNSETGIYLVTSSPSISSNTISNSQYGVMATGSSNPTITNNTIKDNTSWAIYLEDRSSGATINGNTITGAKPGIYVWGSVGIISSLTWASLNAPYVIATGNAPYGVTVAQGSTLTISPEVVVKFEQNAKLHINGSMVADGTPEKKIVFTSLKDDSYGGDSNGDGAASVPAKGDWGSTGGIYFNNASINNLLDNVVVKYAQTGVSASTSSLTISNSSISNSSNNGISVSSASPTITGSTISNNQYGIYAVNSSHPTLSENTITNNTTQNIYVDSTSSINQPPTASIFSPSNGSTFTTLDTISFNGSQSSDPDGDALSYEWSSSKDGVLGTTATLSKKLSAGSHTISLKVSDGKGGQDTKSVNITVTQAKERDVKWNSHSTPTAIKPGEMVGVPINLTNTGSLTWAANAGNQVYVTYHWYNSNWQPVEWGTGLRSSFTINVTNSQTVTITASLKAPSTPGSYNLFWDMVQENVTWFSAQGAPLIAVSNITVAAERQRDLQWVSQGTPTTIKPGEIVGVPITLTNTGSLNWSKSGANPTYLAYHWLNTSGQAVVWDGLRTVLPNDLSSGQLANLTASLMAPSTPGTYRLFWDMVQESVAWFSGGGAPVLVPADITVAATKAKDVQWVSHNTPTNLSANQQVNANLTLTNTGSQTWSKSGANPVFLSYHWLNTSTGAVVVWDGLWTALPQDVVVGQMASISTGLKAPTTSGTYNLMWDIVQDGVGWFSGEGALVLPVSGITVSP